MAAIEQQPRTAVPAKVGTAVAPVNSAVAAAIAPVRATEAAPIKASTVAEVPPEVPANAAARADRVIAVVAQEVAVVVDPVAVVEVVADAGDHDRKNGILEDWKDGNMGETG